MATTAISKGIAEILPMLGTHAEKSKALQILFTMSGAPEPSLFWCDECVTAWFGSGEKECVEAIHDGSNKIKCIKELREYRRANGGDTGLRECKEWVEDNFTFPKYSAI